MDLREINSFLLAVILFLLGGIGWYLKRLSDQFYRLVTDDHVHRSEFIALETRLNITSNQVSRLRGEFDAHEKREENA